MSEVESAVVETFVEAARGALSTMAMMDVEVEGVALEVGVPSEYELLTTIELCGPSGLRLGLGYGPRFAREFVAALVGDELDSLTEADLDDGAGELANMVAGSAKAALSERDVTLSLTIPVVGRAEAMRDELDGRPTTRVSLRVGKEPLGLMLWPA